MRRRFLLKGTTSMSSNQRNGFSSPVNQSNVDYIDSLYVEYKQNPDAVTIEWKRFFEGLEFGGNESNILTA